MNVLITGNSSGLGRGLTEAALARGWTVFGLSRRGCDLPGVHDVRCDLADHEAIGPAINRLLAGVGRLELVILNAGVLGEIADLQDTDLESLKQVMEINVWANKTLIDALIGRGVAVGQIVGISSGAAVLGNRGSSGYALSKAALNMLLRLYARELPQAHVSALAPGLIDSRMIDTLCSASDPVRFPALERIRAARGTDRMLAPREAAERVLSVLPALLDFPSGEFVDIRQIDAPEEYAELMARSRP
ncbi:MAG: SDR family NAD(P)-dependent oxidoreductase [Halothiobacillaceae bacterium]